MPGAAGRGSQTPGFSGRRLQQRSSTLQVCHGRRDRQWPAQFHPVGAPDGIPPRRRRGSGHAQSRHHRNRRRRPRRRRCEGVLGPAHRGADRHPHDQLLRCLAVPFSGRRRVRLRPTRRGSVPPGDTPPGPGRAVRRGLHPGGARRQRNRPLGTRPGTGRHLTGQRGRLHHLTRARVRRRQRRRPQVERRPRIRGTRALPALRAQLDGRRGGDGGRGRGTRGRRLHRLHLGPRRARARGGADPRGHHRRHDRRCHGGPDLADHLGVLRRHPRHHPAQRHPRERLPALRPDP